MVRLAFNQDVDDTLIERIGRYVELVENRMVGRIAGHVDDLIINYLMRYFSSVQLCPEYPEGVHVEIGTLFGGSLIVAHHAIVHSGFKPKIHVIDPFEGYYRAERDIITNEQVSLENLQANLRTAGIGEGEIIVHRGLSHDMAIVSQVQKLKIISLFIDGDHSYNGVRSDWLNYSPLVAEGGCVLLDNYNDPAWPDVMRFANGEILGKSNGNWDVVLVHGSSLLLRRTPRKNEMPTSDLQRLASELLSKNARVEELTEELSASQSRHNAVVSQMRTDTGALSRSLDDCRQEAERLRVQLKEATTKSELEIRTLRLDFREALGRFEAEVNAIRTEKRLLEYERKKTKEQKREDVAGREDQLQRALHEAESKYAELSRYLDVIQSSLSWKLTAPIRKVKEMIFPGWKG
jgi:hypothetical protein